MDVDLTKDRQELANFQVQMATLVGQVEQLRKEMSAITRDVGDKVKDTLEPAVKEVTTLKKEIKQKKIIAMRTVKIWDFFRFKKLGRR